MLLKPCGVLPHGPGWKYELKFDGFRGIAVKDGDKARLFSRNGRDLSKRFARIAEAVRALPAKAASLDGEIVYLDDRGRPSFEDLQNCVRDPQGRLFFYAFDLTHLNGLDTSNLNIEKRKDRLAKLIADSDLIRLSEFVEAPPDTLLTFARENRLEGIVAKRCGSLYESGKRTGAWQKYKTYQTREFSVGGFLPSARGPQSLAVGFLRQGVLVYAARIDIYLRGKPLVQLSEQLATVKKVPCPFQNVPIKKRADTWSVGLTAEDAAAFVWVEPKLKVMVRFTEWTRSGLLRHAGLISG